MGPAVRRKRSVQSAAGDGWRRCVAELACGQDLSDGPRMVTKSAQLPTLGLAGDGDELFVLMAVERSFGVSFRDGETRSWQTVGDFYDTLVQKLPVTSMPGKCSTSMAFYDVRRYLRSVGSAGVVSPSTKLRHIASIRQADLRKGLGRMTDTAPLPAILGWLALTGFVLMFSGVANLLVSSSPTRVALWAMAAIVGWMIVRSQAGSFGSLSVGELSREFANANFAAFAKRGADARPTAIWRSFRGLLAQEIGVCPEHISRQTRLLA